uniref:Uncharacterized protein n=1 Tax=viral metagenome TaxID=1070528 RepID=A0A6H1ZW31_9ZZZZ
MPNNRRVMSVWLKVWKCSTVKVFGPDCHIRLLVHEFTNTGIRESCFIEVGSDQFKMLLTSIREGSVREYDVDASDFDGHVLRQIVDALPDALAGMSFSG